MITQARVLTTTVNALAESSAINAWSLSSYSKPISIWLGEDGVNPPQESDCPVIVVTPGLGAYDMGSGQAQRSPSVEVDFVLLDKSIDDGSSDSSESSDAPTVKTFTGLLKADELANLILAALVKTFGDDQVRTANYSLDATLRYPLIEGGFSLGLAFDGGLSEPELT